MDNRFMHWKVSAQDSGAKLLRYLYVQLKEQYSLKALKRALDGHGCSVNERKERFANFRLSMGDRVAFDCAFLEPVKQPSFDAQLVLFEDDFFLIYNKPAGVVSDAKGLLHLLQRQFPTMVAVHRLDKETSGAIIYAKSESVKEKFIALFKAKGVSKEYLAIVDGVPKAKHGVVATSLGKVRASQGQAVWGEVPLERGGLAAETRWRLVRSGSSCALLACEPVTGRTHQIRIHLSLLGHPILGDHRYGRGFKCPYPAKRHLLHAQKLSFPHPVSGQRVSVEAACPSDFLEAEHCLFHQGKVA